MGTKTVRLNEDVYERVRSKKREDETFSEAIDRLTSGASLLDLEGTLSDEEADDVHGDIEKSREADVEESKNGILRDEEDKGVRPDGTGELEHPSGEKGSERTKLYRRILGGD